MKERKLTKKITSHNLSLETLKRFITGEITDTELSIMTPCARKICERAKRKGLDVKDLK